MSNDISDSLKAGGGNPSESFPGETQRQTAGLLQPSYQAAFSPESKIIITIDDLFFGSIFDSHHFKESERIFGGYRELMRLLPDYQEAIIEKRIEKRKIQA